MVQDGDVEDVGLVPDHRDADDARSSTEAPAQEADHAGEHSFGTGCKYTSFDDRPGSTHNLLVGLVPEGSRVLEFGCATGYMSEVLAEQRGCTVVGVELDPEAAREAEAHCERVIAGDAERLDYDELLGDERFDAILFGDVLEHLREPGALLVRLRPFLAEGGAVIASLPNVAHGSVRLALLAGEFSYRPTGLLDDTHLRFFTHASAQDLFESASYAITRRERVRVPVDETEIRVPPGVATAELRAQLAADPEATTYQFVLRAVPAEEGALLAELRGALAEAEEQLRELEPLPAALAEQCEQLAAAAERNAELEQAAGAARAELARLEEQLAATSEALQSADEREQTARETLAAFERERDELRATAAGLEAEIAGLETVVAELEAARAERDREAQRLEHARAELEAERDALREQVAIRRLPFTRRVKDALARRRAGGG